MDSTGNTVLLRPHRSFPRMLGAGLLLVGMALLTFIFVKFGWIYGMGAALIPVCLGILYFTAKDPANSMLLLVVVNYFVMYRGISSGTPVGLVLDAFIAYNIAVLVIHAFFQHIEWRRATTGLTLISLLWMLYCLLELFNPESISIQGWTSSARSLGFYFFFIVVLTQLTMSRYKYLQQLLGVWSVLTLIAVGKALYQKYVGFTDAEYHWLYVDGGYVTHIIYSGIRYFSFYSDATNFSAGMGLAMVVFSITSLYTKHPLRKLYFLFVAAVACYGLLISGTRSALAVPFVGYTVFVLLSHKAKLIITGSILIFSAFAFLNFTHIGQGNALIRRVRSAFNTQDESFQVRLRNQAKLRVLMADKPFGAGIGHGGGKAKVFAPDAPISQIPTDSWYVMVWVETGIVGLTLHICILLCILGYGAFLVFFRLKNERVRGVTSALIAGVAGVAFMAYANEVLGQIPTGIFIYMSMAFIFMSPRFDRELTEAEKPLPLPAGEELFNRHALDPDEEEKQTLTPQNL